MGYSCLHFDISFWSTAIRLNTPPTSRKLPAVCLLFESIAKRSRPIMLEHFRP